MSDNKKEWQSSKEWIKDVLSKSGTDLMEIQKPKGIMTTLLPKGTKNNIKPPPEGS